MSGSFKCIPVIVATVGCAVLAGALSGCPAGPATGANFVGTAVCLQCHNGILAPGQLEFLQSAHNGIECEVCHGPGQAHVRNGGRGGLFIVNPDNLPFDEHYQVCSTCHEQTVEQYKLSDHAEDKVVRCSGCHDVHTPSALRLPDKDNTLCLQCHVFTDFPGAEEIEAHTHHPVDPEGSGASRCTPCHMPPLRRLDQDNGPHDHSLRGIAPIRSNQSNEVPVPPNSCVGTAGCHDGSTSGEPVFSVDDSGDNALLQQIFEAWFGEDAGQLPD